MLDFARIRFVTANFSHLQGLQTFPWAACCAARVAWDLGWLSWLPRNSLLTPSSYGVLALSAAWLIHRLIGRFYRRSYGTVSPDAAMPGAGIVPIVVIGYFALTAFVGRQPGLPDIGMLFIAACLGWTAYAQRPFRPHFALLSVGACVLSCAVLLAISLSTLDVIYGVALTLGLGVAGTGDHRLLVHTFPEPPATHADAR